MKKSTQIGSIKRENGFLRIILPNSIGVDESWKLQTSIESNLLPEKEQLIIDFSETSTLYSPGLGILIRLRKLVTESNGALYLVNVSKKLRDIFNELNLDKVFQIYATDVEFEMSQKDVFEKKLSEEHVAFLFIPQLENETYFLTFSGQMTCLNDLSSFSNFQPDGNINKFVISLESLDLIDTYGTQLFNDLSITLNNLKCNCAIYGANKVVRELLEVLPSQYNFIFCENEKEAIESVTS